MGKSIREFAEEMSVVMPRLMREFLKRQTPVVAATGEISFAQMAILHILKDRKKCKMTEMAELLFITTSAATGIVDRMVKAGFLKRILDPDDRRVINIELTPKGKKAIDMVFKSRQKMMIGIFNDFSPKEREDYLKLVNKIYSILIKDRQ